jgi:hypothetical protein
VHDQGLEWKMTILNKNDFIISQSVTADQFVQCHETDKTKLEYGKQNI